MTPESRVGFHSVMGTALVALGAGCAAQGNAWLAFLAGVSGMLSLTAALAVHLTREGE